ncbi:GMC family oxidoreductase N-terminal domain-containing protein [Leptospira fainei]|nr:GMC family oxidoreductase [Leptospira fainei]
MENYDAIVIGSGFGGSINALRISEAGKSVLVLERGKRFHPGEFPRDVRKVEELFWKYPKEKNFRGLYELNFFSGLGTITASGLGGGSLIYANVHIRPDKSVFENARWPSPFSRSYLDPYYDKVAEKLQVKPLPASWDIPKRTEFHRAAEINGHSCFDPDAAVSWQSPASKGQVECKKCAECEFGCNYGAKNTLDYNYIRDAESNGAIFRTGAYVSHISTDSKDGYTVHYIDLESGQKRSASGQRVVLSAGTLGTNRILFNSRDTYKTLPNISRRLGWGYSANGDFLGAIENSRKALHPWDGPDVTTVINYFPEGMEFTLAAPTFNEPVMAFLASLGLAKPGWFLRAIAPFFWKLAGRMLPLAFKSGLLSHAVAKRLPGSGDPIRMTNLFAIGRDNANGLVVRSGRDIDVKWRYSKENKLLIQNMSAVMRQVGDAYGGEFGVLSTFLLFNRILSVHSLGGCHLAVDSSKGVVSTNGEVFGYPGLFVADGSVIPNSIGFHPVMTISAVSEHIAEYVSRSFNRV